MGGTMKDVNGILPKINAGIYRLAKREKGKSEIWNLFAEIKRYDDSLVHGFLCCRKCMSLHKFDGKRTSNLNRHRCYKMLMNTGGDAEAKLNSHRCYKMLMNTGGEAEAKVKHFFEMMEGSQDNDEPVNPLAIKKPMMMVGSQYNDEPVNNPLAIKKPITIGGSQDNYEPVNPLAIKKPIYDDESDMEGDNTMEDCVLDIKICNDKVDSGEDTKGGNYTDNDDDYEPNDEDGMEDSNENTTENIKIPNPLDMACQLDDSQHYNEPSTFKRKKYTPYITPTRVQRNIKQLNSLFEMMKSDLHDAPDDLFFVAKWKIMDILREVQSKRLERQNSESNRPTGFKKV